MLLKYLIHILFSLSVVFAGSYERYDKTPAINSALVISNDTLPTAPRVLPGLAPETAKVKARLLHKAPHAKKTGSLVLSLKINKVLGYGANTPLIAPGDTLKANYILNNETPTTNKELVYTLSYKKNLNKGNKKSIISWYVMATKRDNQ